MTFVFVSLRTWDSSNPNNKIENWLEEKRDKKEWKQVEYIDGAVLETWLDMHPAVAARYARYELSLMPQVGIRSIDEFWLEYASRFERDLTEDVLLCDREAQAETLLRALSGGPERIHFAADSPDEIIAFAVAAIRRADEAVRLYLEARTIVVDTKEAARLIAVKRGLIFLPRGQARETLNNPV